MKILLKHIVCVCVCYMILCCKCVHFAFTWFCVCISMHKHPKGRRKCQCHSLLLQTFEKCLSLKQAVTIWVRLTILQASEDQLCLPSFFSSLDTGQEGMTTWGFELWSSELHSKCFYLLSHLSRSQRPFKIEILSRMVKRKGKALRKLRHTHKKNHKCRPC